MSKICIACKKKKSLDAFRYRERKGHYYESSCKECDDLRVRKYRTTTKKGVVARKLSQIKTRCKKKDIICDLDAEWILSKLDSQEWKCELTGIEMSWNAVRGEEHWAWNAISADRINPKGGYTKKNVRFIINQVNIFRGDGPDERMKMIAKKLLS